MDRLHHRTRAQFFFLDSDISTESIEALLAALEATDGAAANRQSIAETLNTAVHGSTAFLWALGLTAVLWALCLVGAAVQKERRAALLVPLLLGALLEAALILYLAIQGRMPTPGAVAGVSAIHGAGGGPVALLHSGRFDSASSVWPQRWGSAVGCCASLG